jgi:hypothetical protein
MMSSYDEVNEILLSKGIQDSLDKNDKLHISHDIHSKLPISLDIMACYNDELPSMDIDNWNTSKNRIRALMADNLFDEEYFLFIKASPKNFMLTLNKDQLKDLIFSNEFCYPFALFSCNLGSFLMEEKSGTIVGFGDFSRVFKSEL